jgi:hypothetical protein
MQNITRILGGLAVAAAFVGTPHDVTAQVATPAAPAAAPVCTAEVLPAEIAAGVTAVRLSVVLSEDVGNVTSMEAAEGSGITVSAPADLPRVPLATEEPQAIAAGIGENTWNVWVNTNEVDPGTHAVTFIGPEGRCTADLTVTAPI